MIKISNRLKSLEKYVSEDDRIMDVGCDHALLDIYLVLSGRVSKIFVGDVNPNALQNGIDNIQKYELSNNIFPILSYGIEKINELDVDTLIISGMGAKNIMDILSSPNLDRVYKLILQSTNNYNDLRRFLVMKGYNIYDEEVIADGKKTYINIVALFSDHPVSYTDMEYEFGPLLITRKENLSYFKNLRMNYENIYFSARTDEAREKLENLKEIIKNLELL